VHLSAETVYVDSGSVDDSVAIARAARANILELEMHIPFTAARARNAGFLRLLELSPEVDYVFFVDGDCEVDPGWLDKAARFLDQHEDVAVVSGLRRERFPDKSIYNLLIDIEWRDYPFGEVKFCGGDALIRATAFKQVNGFRPDMICGEEPEMCVRLRQQAWRIWRLNEPMATHDAAMLRFGQWWKRELRTGYAFAQGASLHGAPPERHSVNDSRRAWAWGLGLPLGIAIMTAAGGEWCALACLIYPVQIVRLAFMGKRSRRENWARAAALVIGKFPQVIGELKFLFDRMRGTQAHLIEYK
jgi:glycosyltransferase involved in cell wall biosynthesis